MSEVHQQAGCTQGGLPGPTPPCVHLPRYTPRVQHYRHTPCPHVTHVQQEEHLGRVIALPRGREDHWAELSLFLEEKEVPWAELSLFLEEK